jgi:PncC family amidohydrolase
MSDSESFEARAGEILKARGMTVTAAESCTGGLILHRLTNVAGSSAYVLGGLVTYSNETKVKFLGVQQDTLDRYGAVSEQTAAEMAHGARQALHADVALSVTGIAGPGGGTPTKPVGLTYIGIEAADFQRVVHYVWTGDRESNKAASADAALQLLLEYLTRSA